MKRALLTLALSLLVSTAIAAAPPVPWPSSLINSTNVWTGRNTFTYPFGSGAQNTGYGVNVLLSVTSGGANTALGYNALYGVSVGGGNVAVGAFTLQNDTNNNNSAVGYNALSGNTTGSANTGVGNSVGNTNTSGTYMTFLGYAADTTIDGLTNSTAVGSNAKVSASNQIVLGNASVTSVTTSGQIGAPSFLPNILYSAAGTPLPTCNAAAKGTLAVVKDATVPTYLGAYVSGGAVVAPVVCNAASAWVTY